MGTDHQAWICPTAPERLPKDRIGGSITTDVYAGAYNAAWIVPEPFPGDWKRDGVMPQNTPLRRAGSYALNNWMFPYFPADSQEYRTKAFWTEADIRDASHAPMMGDGVRAAGDWPMPFGPSASDYPANNLALGQPGSGMGAFTISRHGSRPPRPPTTHFAFNRLPGSINLSFYDGRVELVQLEKLWRFEWHKDYQPPHHRPGVY